MIINKEKLKEFSHSLYWRKIAIYIISKAHMQQKGKTPKYLNGDRKNVDSYIYSFYHFNLFGKLEAF